MHFVGGLLISEGLFGWATETELQPNIDGLSFDEVLIIGLVPGIVSGIVSVVGTWWFVRTRHHEPLATLTEFEVQ